MFFYSWKILATMGVSYKTVIMSVAGKIGDYIQKYLEISYQKL